uniref:Uncharacterized protein n=1 Tax=Oryctolagus cuniculus TaxID=9986 RepID=A0A5F9DFP7_RABIT
MSHREDPQSCLLNQLPESQNSNLKRESRYPERKRKKLMPTQMRLTLQKTELPKQTRIIKLSFWRHQMMHINFANCVLLVTIQFEILF